MADEELKDNALQPTNGSIQSNHVATDIISTNKLFSEMIYNKDQSILDSFKGTDNLLNFLRVNRHGGLQSEKPENIYDCEWVNDIPSPNKESAFDLIKKSRVADDSNWIQERETLVKTFSRRVEAFGENILPPRKPKSFVRLMINVLNDKMMLLLVFAATVSTGMGIYEDVRVTGNPEEDKNNVNWIEGFSIIIAIAIIVLFTASNDFFRDKRFSKLNYKKNDRQIYVTRNGIKQRVSVNNVLVGDIMHVESGEILCADAVVISSSDLKADESAISGESKPLLKLSSEEYVRQNMLAYDDLKKYDHLNLKATDVDNQVNNNSPLSLAEEKTSNVPLIKSDPFLISGSLIVEGVGECVIVAVGENSFNGQTLMALTEETEATPLQIKLNMLAETIAKIGGLVAIAMFFALMIRYIVFILQRKVSRASNDVASSIVNIITSVLTIIVVAIPEGLPLAITLSLAIATIRMLDDNCMVRTLASCETMGNATTICSDKTGTLTQNKFTVITGTIGTHLKFRLYPSGAANVMRRQATETPNDEYVTDALGKPVLKNELGTNLSLEKNTQTSEIDNIYNETSNEDELPIDTDSLELELPGFKKVTPKSILEIVYNSIAINSTAFQIQKEIEDDLDIVPNKSKSGFFSSLKNMFRFRNKKNNGALDPSTEKSAQSEYNNSSIDDFFGSSTEVALLQWAQRIGEQNILKRRENAEKDIFRLYPFSSAKKSMCVLVENGTNDDGEKMYRLFVKGAPESLLLECKYVLNYEEAQNQEKSKNNNEKIKTNSNSVPVLPLDKDRLKLVSQVISDYSSRSLRTIGVMYCDISDSSLKSIDYEDSVNVWKNSNGLTWIGVFGIEDPLRENVSMSVRQCQKAGVMVRMVTGDSLITARAIATQCGIYTPGMGGIVLEGKHFRSLKPEELDVIVPRLQVLARSTPKDKQILVNWLKDSGEVVAVTGDGTNDGPALKSANVGFSMGLSGTEIAKEASDIILMDDNFSSIIRALMWGRSVNDSIRKFLQFQLTVNVTAVIISFITSLQGNTSQPVFTPTQLLWLNLIMDTFAALALASDPPTLDLINRYPEKKNSPILNASMWKNIIGMAIYQIAMTFITLYVSSKFFKLNYNDEKDFPILRSMAFNSFVWMQLFNEINSRVLGPVVNCFKGLTKNNFFMVILIGSAIVQVIIVEYANVIFQTRKLTAAQWAYCIIVGFIALPVGLITRLFPDKWFIKVFPFGKNSDYKKPSSLEWQAPAQTVQRQLALLSVLRGGRLKSNNLLGLKIRSDALRDKETNKSGMDGFSESEIRKQQQDAISRVINDIKSSSNNGSNSQHLNNVAMLSEYGPSEELKQIGIKSTEPGTNNDGGKNKKSGIISKFKNKKKKKKAAATGFSFAAAMVPTMVGASIGAGMSASTQPKDKDLSEVLATIFDEKEQNQKKQNSDNHK
ncbi:hypothetical protein BB561_002417 [Smittium simulii]|uniref:Calcium-transporting ATPase n=1 Tax=Smittium simulii TaxID=133385 RepID=A0A2T9YQI2_9FUNG|nr:hypothetical protein BB561_002417 [Smittium simulii]